MTTAQNVKNEKAGNAARVYSFVERAAIEGRRCPTNAEIAAYLNESGATQPVAASTIPGIFSQLVRDGLVTVRVYGNNWRDIIILQGRHTGKTTLPPPHGGKPHIVIDKTERERRDKNPRWQTTWIRS